MGMIVNIPAITAVVDQKKHETMLSAGKNVISGSKRGWYKMVNMMNFHYLPADNTRNVSFSDVLTQREKVVLQLIAAGYSRKEIAADLYLSLNTVKTHTKNLYSKLRVHSRKQAIVRAQELGYLPPATKNGVSNGIVTFRHREREVE